jgi:radical SAM enzyme (rSAM/lipoprotein system)
MAGFIEKEVHRQLKKIEHREHQLSYLFWECTWRCNLSCLHCGSDCHAASTHKDMPAEDFLNVLDRINEYDHKPILIAITGGEPLLRKDLEECGYNIRKKGFYWGIVTNGFAYNQERHRSLLSAGMGAITLSLDGLQNTHNWLRNHPRSYERAIDAMNLIASSYLTSDVVTCVHKRNLPELEALYSIICESGMKAWRLFTITPIGRAKLHPELDLTAEEFTALMNFIKDKRAENRIDVKFSCEGYVGRYEKQVRDDRFFCRAGIHIGSVLIDGSIGACPNIDRSFIQGNIYQDDFMDVWNNRFEPYRNRKWMKTGICAGCKAYRYCEGNGMHYRMAGQEDVLTCHCGKVTPRL